MKTKTALFRCEHNFTLAALVLLCFVGNTEAAERLKRQVNAVGAVVREADGSGINYSQEQLSSAQRVAAEKSDKFTASPSSLVTSPQAFIATPANANRPFWQYAIFGSGIGASNVIIVPAPAGGGTRDIIVGGSSGSGFGGNDFWQILRRTPKTGNYDQVFVSPLYSSAVKRIAVANVTGDSQQEIIVMLENGRIYFYNFATRKELGYRDTGFSELSGLSLTDLNGDGYAEIIIANENLYVLNGAGSLLWKVAGAGGYDVVAGQMDNDPALEIAGANGAVVDAASHSIQWRRTGGFGAYLKLAPLPGANYQQLITAEGWSYVYAYDVAKKLPRWSMNVFDIDALQVADVDNDGMPEIIIGDGQGHSTRA